MSADAVNALLKRHAAEAGDWAFCEPVRWLHLFAERFNDEFALDLGTPALDVKPLRVEVWAKYRAARNGLALRHTVAFNTDVLALPPAEQLVFLFRELLRMWQGLHGPASPGSYCNGEFRRKALGYGLTFDARGQRRAVDQDGPFAALLRRHGVDTAPLAAEAPLPEGAGSSKLKKWSCACTNIRAAVPVDLECRKCGRRLTPAASRKRKKLRV